MASELALSGSTANDAFTVKSVDVFGMVKVALFPSAAKSAGWSIPTNVQPVNL